MHFYGNRNCPEGIKQQLRMAKGQYKRQLRALRREINSNIADSTTANNCFNRMFRKTQQPPPAVIDGHTRDNQPQMWRDHFKNVFKAEEFPHNGEICSDIHVSDNELNFTPFHIDEINTAICNIDTNKSYKRHYHWKYLLSNNHLAKRCLLTVFNAWSRNVLLHNNSISWDLFETDLNTIPKKGKKDLSTVRSYRPICVGTSENWILEKVFLSRLEPYLSTHDCQMGYKSKHSTSHAIEIVRLIERKHDAHVCVLDASAAFDKLSWSRIKCQLIKRNVPLYLTKLILNNMHCFIAIFVAPFQYYDFFMSLRNE